MSEKDTKDLELEKHYAEKTGAKCGHCGKDLTYADDMGNGFCRDCTVEHDKN